MVRGTPTRDGTLKMRHGEQKEADHVKIRAAEQSLQRWKKLDLLGNARVVEPGRQGQRGKGRGQLGQGS